MAKSASLQAEIQELEAVLASEQEELKALEMQVQR